LLILNTALLS
jgi:hypothetical protein